MGRKRIEIDLAEVERLAACGLNEYEIADGLGIGVTTLERRKGEETEEGEAFREALRRGKARGIGKVANALFDKAVGGNVVAQIFYLKARAGWKETSVTEIRDVDGEWSRDEILERIRRAVAGGGAGAGVEGTADPGD